MFPEFEIEVSASNRHVHAGQEPDSFGQSAEIAPGRQPSCEILVLHPTAPGKFSLSTPQPLVLTNQPRDNLAPKQRACASTAVHFYPQETAEFLA